MLDASGSAPITEYMKEDFMNCLEINLAWLILKVFQQINLF